MAFDDVIVEPAQTALHDSSDSQPHLTHLGI